MTRTVAGENRNVTNLDNVKLIAEMEVSAMALIFFFRLPQQAIKIYYVEEMKNRGPRSLMKGVKEISKINSVNDRTTKYQDKEREEDMQMS